MSNTNNQNNNQKKTNPTPWDKLVCWVNGEEIPKGPVSTSEPYDIRKDPGALKEHKAVTFMGHVRHFRKFYYTAAVVLCVAMIALMLFTCSQMPPFGEVDVPTNNEVSQKYIEDGLKDTGATNIVAGMILDYRAFDTLGESTVLFTAVMSVMILLRRDKYKDDPIGLKEEAQLREEAILAQRRPNVVVRTISFILIPFIFLFGIYVVLNGHVSPGGGFSGGAIMGAGLILYATAYGSDKVKKFFNFKVFTGITSGSLLSYAALKCYSFYTGAHHIPTGVPLGTPGAILSSGFILPLNIFVGMIVACTMFGFYSLFSKGEI